MCVTARCCALLGSDLPVAAGITHLLVVGKQLVCVLSLAAGGALIPAVLYVVCDARGQVSTCP